MQEKRERVKRECTQSHTWKEERGVTQNVQRDMQGRVERRQRVLRRDMQGREGERIVSHRVMQKKRKEGTETGWHRDVNGRREEGNRQCPTETCMGGSRGEIDNVAQRHTG